MIANYTTSVPVKRSVAEVQDMLAQAGADHVAVSYDSGLPNGMLFTIGDLGYQLPARVGGVHRALQRQRGATPAQRTVDHARRVAWRIIRDWTRAQLAILQAEMAAPGEVFLPYLVTAHEDGKAVTVYDQWAAEHDRKLLEGP